MPNEIYKKGRRKEYSIIDNLRKDYDILQRSKGSHSPIDVFAINKKDKKILFIQSKRKLNKKMSATDEKQKDKIEKEFNWLNGKFEIEFKVM